MNGFYVSMIFLGMLFVITSIVFLVFDKRKTFEFSKSFESKKQELTEIINDAELMIEELNKFSDYIVNQVDLKSEQLNKIVGDAEARIRELGKRAAAISTGISAAVSEEKSPALNPARKMDLPPLIARRPVLPPLTVKKIDLPLPTQETKNNDELAVYAACAASDGTNDKVIPFRNKYSEVLRLSREGMGNLDIAKSLNMGKGEVELIVGLRK